MTVSTPPVTTQLSPRRLRWGRWGIQSAAWTYVTLMLLIPLAVIFQDGLKDGLGALWQSVSMPIAASALRLTLWTSALMAVINAIMGTLTAYVLVRYEFPGKALLNAIVDLPLAIPTLVTGVMLVILYGPQGTIGGWLENQLGWKIIFAPPGIILALLFVNFPFVVRAVQPVLEELDLEVEEAGASLGASKLTIFVRLILPNIAPAMAAGAALSFARGLGEFGSVVLISGSLPRRTEVASVRMLGQIENDNLAGASAVATVLLVVALIVIVLLGVLQRRAANRG